MTNKQAYAGLLERLQEMSAEIDGDWAADNQPTSQGGPRADGDPCSPRPVNTPAEAAEAISSLLKAGQRASAFIRDLATCDTMIMAPTLIAEADALDAALNSDAPLSIGEGL